MTAEIAILNPGAIALAADSAVTITTGKSQKTYNTVNKLFALSKYKPVGLMIYGNADFMMVPWEVAIKCYRRRLGKRGFSTIEAYASDFIDFLTDEPHPVFSPESKEHMLTFVLGRGLFPIRAGVEEQVAARVKANGEISDSEVQEIVSQEIAAAFAQLSSYEDLTCPTRHQASMLLGEHATQVDEAILRSLGTLPVSDLKLLREVLRLLLYKQVDINGVSGVVIAGFGDDEEFPSLISFDADGLLPGVLRFKEGERAVVRYGENTASIVPFAQGEMVQTFMEGIDPSYRHLLDGYFTHLFDAIPSLAAQTPDLNLTDAQKETLKDHLGAERERLQEDFWNGLHSYAQQVFVTPIAAMTAALPKDELAAMAEAFVNLTSFKRRVSPEVETVGGPIDVAVISKGDGFVWIKRKHYFQAELNPQFFANYFREDI